MSNLTLSESTPATDTEKTLTKIWAEVLGIPEESLSIRSDFFHIGGHSIKAIRLRALIHKELGVKVQLKEIFLDNTIEQQARLIANKKSNEYKAKELVLQRPDYALSTTQRRIWVLSQFDVTQSAYNIPNVVLLEGVLDKEALKQSFEIIISRHEILRTVFKEDQKGNPRQQIINADAYNFKLKETDLRQTAGKQFVLNKLINKEIGGSFHLNSGPLLHCHLVQLEDTKYILIMVHHRIISDEWSMNVFRKELSTLYNAYSKGTDPQLPLLKIQYKDYAAWHNQQIESDEIIPHKNYWIKQFEGEIPTLELTGDKKRPTVQTFNGASLDVVIDKQVLAKLNNTCENLGGSLFMGLLACVNVLLYRYTNQEDILVGSAITSREYPDLG